MEIIAYDFDGTIYDGDSSVDFYIYTLLRRPYIIILWPIQIIYVILYLLKIINKTKMKEIIFSYLKITFKKDVLLEKFWLKHMKKIKPWYLEKNHEKDVIISASPEFLLKYPCKELKVMDLIASEVDFYSGKFLSENCHGKTKVEKKKKKYKDVTVLEMYTDSKVDMPMIDFAKKGFFVKKNEVIPYDKGDDKIEKN